MQHVPNSRSSRWCLAATTDRTHLALAGTGFNNVINYSLLIIFTPLIILYYQVYVVVTTDLESQSRSG